VKKDEKMKMRKRAGIGVLVIGIVVISVLIYAWPAGETDDLGAGESTQWQEVFRYNTTASVHAATAICSGECQNVLRLGFAGTFEVHAGDKLIMTYSLHDRGDRSASIELRLRVRPGEFVTNGTLFQCEFTAEGDALTREHIFDRGGALGTIEMRLDPIAVSGVIFEFSSIVIERPVM